MPTHRRFSGPPSSASAATRPSTAFSISCMPRCLTPRSSVPCTYIRPFPSSFPPSWLSSSPGLELESPCTRQPPHRFRPRRFPAQGSGPPHLAEKRIRRLDSLANTSQNLGFWFHIAPLDVRSHARKLQNRHAR